MVDFKKRLKKFNSTVKTARERSASESIFGTDLPDGQYKADITNCKVKESNAGELYFVFEFTVKAGEYEGDKTSKWCKIETEDDQVWLDRDLNKFGIALPDDMADLESIAEVINNAQPEVKIQVKSKDSGTFCYLNNVLEEVDFGELGGEIETDESEDEEETDEEEADEGEDESEDEEETDEEEADIEIGMTVCFVNKAGKSLTGSVFKILEDEELVKVKVGKKLYTVDPNELSLPEEDEIEEVEEEEEEEEAPPKKKKETIKKKPTPKPKPKAKVQSKKGKSKLKRK